MNHVLIVFTILAAALSSAAAECLPLELAARFEALPASGIVEADELTLPQQPWRRRNSGGLTILRRTPEGWSAVPQWSEPGTPLFFRLSEGIAPYGRDTSYFAADSDFLRQNGVKPAPALTGTGREPVSLAPAAWSSRVISSGSLELSCPAAGVLRVVYRGDSSRSRVLLTSPALPVKGGEVLRLRLRDRFAAAPAITAATLPGRNPDGTLPSPHEVEDQLTGAITNLAFRNAAGQEISGPDWWTLHRLPWSYPKLRENAITVPQEASEVAFTWLFQGEGELTWEIHEITAIRLPESFIRSGYHLNIAGKTTFPQREVRDSTPGEFRITPGCRITLSPQAAALGLEPAVLLDGLKTWSPELGENGAIRVGLWEEETARREPAEELPPEGYLLTVTPQGVNLLGRDARGIFYGLQELGERLRLGGGATPCAQVFDYPEQELRIVHQLLTWSHPEDPLAYYRKWLPLLARHRINAFAFDVRRDWFELDQPARRAYWEQLAALCRQWQIMPIPMGVNFRNLQPVEEGIQWAAARWADSEPYVLTGTDEVKLRGHADGYYVRSGDDNGFGFARLPDGTRPTLALTGGDNPFLVRSADGSITYRRGEDYEIESDYRFVRGSNDFSLPGNSLTLKWPTGIRRLADGRIPDGATVLVSYNYLYRQRGQQNEHFATCISESHAIARAQQALAQMIEVIRPEWVHINQDEIVGVGRDGRDLKAMREKNRTPGALFAGLLESFKTVARTHGVNHPLIAWSDNFTPTHAGWSQNYNGPFYLYDVRDHIDPADYLIDVWGGVETADDLLKNGYSILVAPLENKAAIVESALYLADRKLRYGAKRVRGIQLSCWNAPDEANFLHLKDFARQAWNPGPWAQWLDGGRRLRLYDLYAEPAILKSAGKPIPLREVPAEAAWWTSWRGSWSREACFPAPPRQTLQTENGQGYGKTLPAPYTE